jgi:hypothetical protein
MELAGNWEPEAFHALSTRWRCATMGAARRLVNLHVTSAHDSGADRRARSAATNRRPGPIHLAKLGPGATGFDRAVGRCPLGGKAAGDRRICPRCLRPRVPVRRCRAPARSRATAPRPAAPRRRHAVDILAAASSNAAVMPPESHDPFDPNPAHCSNRQVVGRFNEGTSHPTGG